MSKAEDEAAKALIASHQLEYDQLVAGIESLDEIDDEGADDLKQAVADTKKSLKEGTAGAKKANKGEGTLLSDEGDKK